MPETTIRWQCATKIVELARVHESLIDVDVEATFPGDEVGPECIYLADLDGTLDVPVTRGPARVVYDDTFEMTWAVEVRANGRTRDETMTACDVLVAALQDVIANDAQLGALPGVISARLTRQNGPLGVEFKAVGLVAVAQVIVAVHSRLT